MTHEVAAITLSMLLLGMRHGFDADHLAAIDALTRLNLRKRPRVSRWTGSLFSLGHGAVVIGVIGAMQSIGAAWQAPTWLDRFGTWVSIGLLAGLGFANLWSVVRTPKDRPAPLAGWRTVGLQRWPRVGHPVAVAGVGALFAVSFDTFGLAALMAAAGERLIDGHFSGLIFGLSFLAGMVLTDGVNGLWIHRLIQRADQFPIRLSHWIGCAVAGVSLATAALAALSIGSDEFANWFDAYQGWCGLAVSSVMALTFVVCWHRWRIGTPEHQRRRSKAVVVGNDDTTATIASARAVGQPTSH